MEIKKGDLFFHKEYTTLFCIDKTEDDHGYFTCHYLLGHPNRAKPWAKYSYDTIIDKCIKVSINSKNIETEQVFNSFLVALGVIYGTK